jgi:hypothetical protein
MVFNRSTLVHYLAFTISRILLAAFFIGLMPQEIVLTPIHPVRDDNNIKEFHYHILQNRLPGFEKPSAHFHQSGSFKATHWCHLVCLLCPFAIRTSYVCFKWPIDYNIEQQQHSDRASWYDYQAAFLWSQLGLHIFCSLALKAV